MKARWRSPIPRKPRIARKRNARIAAALKYLKDHNSTEWYWYGHYYAAHAMHQKGGNDWKSWYEREKKFLLSKQSKTNGSWSENHGEDVGPVYQTAVAVIILSVPQNYLPIFQR